MLQSALMTTTYTVLNQWLPYMHETTCESRTGKMSAESASITPVPVSADIFPSL